MVSINRFSADTDAEIALVKDACKKLGVEALMADHWALGGEGAADVARAVVKVVESGKSKLKLLYPDEMPLLEKVRTIAQKIYRAKDIVADKSVRDQLANFESMGYGKLPVCIAKTQYSLLDQSRFQGRADRLHHSGARGAALRRRRVRGGDLRRDHDHARPAARAGGRLHRRRPGRQDRRVVLVIAVSNRRERGDPPLARPCAG